MRTLRALGAAALAGCGALLSCAGNDTPGPGAPSAADRPAAANLYRAPVSRLEAPVVGRTRRRASHRPANSPIEHVVIIVQENRSFDNLFHKYPGADTVSSGLNSAGQSIKLKPISLAANYDLDHSSTAFFAACDGSPPGENCKMDGFDRIAAQGRKIPPNPQYGYVPPGQSKLYFQMAQQYVLADRMFTSNLDESFVSHQYIIAGQANSAVDVPPILPWGCGGGQDDVVSTLTQQRGYGPSESACFNSQTLADELDDAGLSWRYYAAGSSDYSSYIWSAFQAISHIYNSPEWTSNVISPPQQFLTDVGNGTLATVTWITPTCANSDHLGCLSKTGPEWVASLVNAVGQSQFWNTTTIFVMWDEFGGWYDHVPPPYEDYDGLGMRVPLLMISPYANKGYVSHVQYEHGSILRYVEDNFGLGQLAASDSRANSPANDASFDYAQSPRPFVPFATQTKAEEFVKALPDTRPPDAQ